MPYIKTKIGEHDYHKPACAEFCRMSGDYCPFIKAQREKIDNIVRWSDVADKKVDDLLGDTSGGGAPASQAGYSADFSNKQANGRNASAHGEEATPSEENVSAELETSGYTCWADGSGFEYDQMSRNIMGQGCSVENVYDISNYGIEHEALQFSRWNAWIDKFQYDYRFGRVSDTNAECILFPNVDNPWMFTEYVFKGIGGESDKCAMQIPDEYVVEPPLYDPMTLRIVNGDIIVEHEQDYDAKYANDCNDGTKQVTDNADGSQSVSYLVRRNRKIVNWSDLTTWTIDEANGDEGAYHRLNDGVVPVTVVDAGLKLYRARIPVQSVKWGEHGNIPPHTLDMTAPKSWFDPANMVTKMKAIYDAVIGTAIESPYDGKIEWGNVVDENGNDMAGQQGRQAYVYVDMAFAEGAESSGQKHYSYSGGNRTAVDVPQEMQNGVSKALKPAVKIMPDKIDEEYCHGGCAMLVGRSGSGRLVCKCWENAGNDKEYYNEMLVLSKCLNRGSYGAGEGEPSCKGYVARRNHPQIATYQEKRIAVDQWSNNMGYAAGMGMMMGIAGGVGGALAGGAMASAMMGMEYDKIAGYYSNLGKRGDVDITYVVRYEPVMGSDAQAQLNKKKYNEFGRGVQIVPGTGKYAIDSEQNANPFSGGDTNAYGDINTLSFHRFFASVMHCANHKYCNEITGKAHEQGFSFSERAGGDDGCRYHKSYVNGVEGCPYNCAPKRAIEFAHCASGISARILQFMGIYNSNASYYVWDFNPGELSSATENLYRKTMVGEYRWCVFGSYAVCQMSDEIALLAVRLDGDDDSAATGNIDYSPSFSGAALLANVVGSDGQSIPDGYALFGEFRTSMTVEWILVPDNVNSQYSGGGEYSGEEDVEGHHHVAVRNYSAREGFYWFKPLDNGGSGITANENSPEALRQHVDSNGYWFCKAEPVGMPTTNCVMLDNEDKFIGGWHPEYKDYSKMGSEFMQDVVVEESREGQGKGDYLHNGDYTPIPLTTNKQGYWIDQSGVYIVDERSTGIDEAIASDETREGTGGPGVCISFRKSNTTVNGETGKTIQPKTINGALFSNDPYDLVVRAFRDARGKNELGEPTGRPMFKDPETDNDYLAPLIINSPYLLPTLRHALHCPNCDYYIPYKYSIGEADEESNGGDGEQLLKHDRQTCPWCGANYEIITGDAGEGMDAGSEWAEGASVMRKFFKIYAIGTADVWAPPGTAIKTDAYFWRHQAQITNATRKQIAHRLGDSNKVVTALTVKDGKESGGAYQFNRMSATSEMTLGYPEGLGRFIRIPEGGENDITMRYGKGFIKWRPDEDACVDGMWNPVMPRHMIPEWYGKKDEGEEDEGVIAPYTESSNDALKMASYEQMRVFRNGIEPIYAYVLGNDYSGDYPTYRASYDQREVQDQPIIWQGRRSTIAPQVLACTDDGRDSFQTYFSGDYVYGNVREYFPSGYTWWMLKNTLGGRYTDNLGGGYHMDDGGKQLDGRMVGGSGGEYTCGTRTVAKCALSIYGVVPLDKEILKAYLIISPNGIDPSKDPIGRSWTGGPVMYCHYHALPKDHYEDGRERHLHGTAGYPPHQYFDDDGNFVNERPGTVYYASDDISYQDDSAYRLWGAESHLIDDDRELYYDSNVRNTMTNIPCLYDTAFHRKVGTGKVNVMKYGGSSEVLGVGYNENSFGDIAGFTIYNLSNTEAKRKQKFQYIVVDADGMLAMKYPESVMWKTDTAEQIEKTITNHMATIEFKASDGTAENTKSYQFRQADSELYQIQMPRQSQEITGYFDMSWANTKGYVYDEYAVERKSGGGAWNAPVVFQDGEPATSSGSSSAVRVGYGGGGIAGQIGEVARCMDVTDIVQKLYNKRIDRVFYANAGCTLDEIKAWGFYETLKSEKLPAIDGDVLLQNVQADRQDDGSYLLTDVDTYPDVNGDVSDVPSIDPDGGKYELAKKKARLMIQMSFPLTVNGNGNYHIVIGDNETGAGSIQNGRYDDMASIEQSLKDMFSGADLQQVSAFRMLVTSDEKITVEDDVSDNCYGLLGIYPTIVYPAQDRTYDATSSGAGFEPAGLMGDGNGVWTYDTYDETTQSFAVDLLRAPLCKMQKNWRYEEGDDENPGDGIMTYAYDKPFSPDPYISKMVIAPLQDIRTNYRVFAQPSGFSGWRSVVNVVYRNSIADEDSGYSLVFPGEGNEDISVTLDNGSGEATVLIRDGFMRARHIKVECDSEMRDFLHEYELSDSFDGNGYQVIANGEFASMGMVSLEGIKALILDEPVGDGDDPFDNCDENDLYEIVAAQIVGSGNAKLRIALNRMAYNDGTTSTVNGKHIVFHAMRHTGGISKFKVYGVHYKTEESDDAENDVGSGMKYLTVTDMEDEHRWKISTQTTSYRMPEPPTQILDVSIGTAGTGGVSLSEALTDSTPLRWETVEESVSVMANDENGNLVSRKFRYRRITGGNYFYDVRRGRMLIPRNDQDNVPWEKFEEEAREVNSFRSYMPNTLVMRYWSGNGKSITFKAKAAGHGPSYMVEKNAIQVVSSEIPLPDNGTSCKMLDMDGEPIRNLPIPWICYNNKPSALSIETQSKAVGIQGVTNYSAGEFRKPSFTGKEICDQLENDDAFIKLFGDHCESCYGQCETEVTLTGAPNRIISGTLEFTAQAESRGSVYVGGQTMYYKERTGGLDKGMLIVSCSPVSSGGGRMTVCYGIPELLIYAKEAQIFSETEPPDDSKKKQADDK